MKIYDMKVNHLRNPLGFRMTRTVFSWKVKEAKGKIQKAARIRIAKDAQLQKILADTGFDFQADSLGTKVAVELLPHTRYYWTVTVQTDAGEEETGEIQWFETAKREEPWTAKWITCNNEESRHPIFEKEIAPVKEVAQARLYISGLGLYEASYQGKRIGNEYMTPYSNDYNEWVQYQTFDITELLQEEGVLSIELGNGWYKERFGFDAVGAGGFYGTEWKLLAELQLEYTDGTREVIGTDESWNVRRNTIYFSNIYDGEQRDDTLPELPVEQAVSCEAPKGELTERMSLPVTIHEALKPVELIHTPAGEQVLDIGQEIAGTFALRIHESAGTKIHIQTGEILQQGNFYNENLRSAKSEYIYISDGTEKVLMPKFTYYGYRYVKIEGVSNLKTNDFTAYAFYSDVEQVGEMTTGHELVNKLLSNVFWGLKGNFIDVPTDCPQRDERMGWTGDTQVFSPTAMYLTDSYAFYAKYLYDMAKEQAVRGGKVPDVVPNFSVETTACVWGDASCIIPWNLYLFYGDRSILEDQYESMKSWVDYITGVDGENHGWRDVFHYGDWLALDNPNETVDQVMGGTDEGFIANIYYAASAEIVAKAADILGKEKDAAYYHDLSQREFGIVKDEYYSKTGRCCVNTQTAHLLTLKYHLSENEAWIKKNLRKLFLDNNDKLKTGFVGTPLLGNVLTDHGFSELAYILLLNEENPGWLHEIKLGATTVWERWNSVLDDGSISSTGMNSLNHYSYGAIVEWMYRHVAGIDFDPEAPGSRRAVIEPQLNWKLKSAETSYNSPAGEYRTNWKILDRNHVEVFVDIPFGCTAKLRLANAVKGTVVECVEKNNCVTTIHAEEQTGVFYLSSGHYHVIYETCESLKKEYNADMSVRELLGNSDTKEVYLQMIPGGDHLPQQFLDMNLRELGKTLNTHISEEQIEALDKALRAL